VPVPVPVRVPVSEMGHWGSEAVAGPLTAALPHCLMGAEMDAESGVSLYSIGSRP